MRTKLSSGSLTPCVEIAMLGDMEVHGKEFGNAFCVATAAFASPACEPDM
jgi:hypothetical protein